MKKLNKTEQYAILHMLANNQNVEQICNELKIEYSVVQKFVEKNNKVASDKKLKVKSSKITSKDLMISKTSVKGNRSVSIMTKEASQVNDEFKKNTRPSVSRTAKNSIHKPNGK